MHKTPCNTPTEGDPDNVSGRREEVLAVVGVGGGGQRPCWITGGWGSFDW